MITKTHIELQKEFLEKLIATATEQLERVNKGLPMNTIFDYWHNDDLVGIVDNVNHDLGLDLTEEEYTKYINEFCANNMHQDANNPLSYDDIINYFHNELYPLTLK